ncbi:HAD family hydrolase [Bacillus testis]|uniref:HAD family hydrolase n=1 Tax=Bacillus testis TaxID=1622072 RepID=UPI000B0F3119|nr:HAD family phosphatase [Bacillus testis]
MIKAIIFDFDGLIIDTESVWYEAYKEAFKECNIELLLEEFVRCIGTNDDILSTIIREKTGRDTEIELIKKRAMALHSNKMENPVVREGVESYLQEAKEAGYSTAIASSSTFAWIDGFFEKIRY